MAFKELCFGIVVLFIATSIIGEVQAQALNGESSEQPGSIQNSTDLNKRKAAVALEGDTNTISLLEHIDGVQTAHAVYYTINQPFTGFQASVTVYNPTIKNGQMSKTYINIQSTLNQNSEETEEIEAGWMVDPMTYGDSRPRFYTHFKGAKSYGFVLKEDAYLKPGSALDEGNHLTFKFLKDDSTGNWGLYVGPGTAYLSQIGYFPASLFTVLSSQATSAEFGGCVKFINNLTSPPMGNGVFAKDDIPAGQPTPAMMTDITFIKPDGGYYPINSYSYRLGYLSCYGLGKLMADQGRFVYGGPGGCSS